MKKISQTLFLVFTYLLLNACAGPNLKIEPIENTADPSKKIFELEESITNGRAEQVNILSPTWYAKAESYLDKARYSLAGQESATAILRHVAYGYAHFNKARENAEIAKATIPRAIRARDLAREAGATIYSSAYQGLENQFISLTMDIENGQPERAKKFQDKVITGYADLELRAIKEKTLGEVRNLLAVAEVNNAEDTAPTMLAIAQKALNDADQFITEQRYERQQMQEKAKYALFQAQRLGQVMDLSRKLENMSPEALALWSEARLHQITVQLGAADLRNESTGLQLENIIQSIVSLQEDNNSLKQLRQQESAQYRQKIEQLSAQLEEQQQQIAILEGNSKKVLREREVLALKEKEAQERLDAERRFQQLFNEVQGLFPNHQAEVYKQAEKLVIRLKAMRFPVGKDLILPDNYPLLSLVRQAIRTFGNPDVVIEGHTDSTGSEAINEQLSQNRAEAVRQYFIANGTLSPKQITAVGFGAVRPLATNDTPEGRAINRRIDVVIKTTKAAE